MSQIDEPIPESATEQIRDRIALIIAQEMWVQAQWKYDDDLLVDVYLERTSDFSHSEVPAVNVMYADSDMLGETLETQDGLHTFFIDVYTKASTTGTGVENRADRLAGVKLHKLLHVINKILMHKKYKRLLFAAPFISNRRVASIKMTNPQNPNDTTSTVWGRIEFTVRAPENQLDVLPVTLDGIDTQVQLDESAKGYLWGNNSVTPAVPVCDPATLLLNSDPYGTISSGSELNLFIVNAIGYPVGSIDGALFEISSSKIYANDAYLKAILAEDPYNLTIIDTDGDEVPIKVIDENTVEVPAGVSNISYIRNAWTINEVTSLLTGDCKYYIDNTSVFNYTVNGVKPVLDPNNDLLLLTLNAYGNNNRVTNDRGGSNFADVGGGLTSDGATANYAVDNYTGQGYYLQSIHAGTQSFNDSVTTAAAFTLTAYDSTVYGNDDYGQFRMLTYKDTINIQTGDGSTNILTGIQNWSDTVHFIMFAVNATTVLFWRDNFPITQSVKYQTINASSINAGVDLIVCRNHF